MIIRVLTFSQASEFRVKGQVEGKKPNLEWNKPGVLVEYWKMDVVGDILSYPGSARAKISATAKVRLFIRAPLRRGLKLVSSTNAPSIEFWIT